MHQPLRLAVAIVFIGSAILLGTSVARSADPATTERISGSARADTAAALARATTGSPSMIYLVSSDDFADALAAGVAASHEGMVLLVHPNGVPEATAVVLADHPDARLVVVGGTRRLPAGVDEEIARLSGRRPTRVAGANRYATATALAQQASPAGVDTVWLTSGVTAPDALSAGAAAASQGGALLLTARQALPQATIDALRVLSPRRAVVVGGTAAVSDDVVGQLQSLVDEVSRIGGADRYATAAAVARAAFPQPSAALITTGRVWADALAATPLAASLEAPVLLVPRRCVPADAAETLAGVQRIVIAGGPAAVSPRVDDLAACRDEIAGVTTDDLGPSWRPGCPVEPADLRRIMVDYHTFEGDVKVGSLVVHRRVAPALVGVFDQLFAERFPFERVTAVDAFDASDAAAMAANATTAFNCRAVTGRPGVWSEHSYGTAIDINPVQNPYVTRNTVEPSAGGDFVDRGAVRPGMVVTGGVVDSAFAAIGWEWGGRWRTIKDYQHFSESGR